MIDVSCLHICHFMTDNSENFIRLLMIDNILKIRLFTAKHAFMNHDMNFFSFIYLGNSYSLSVYLCNVRVLFGANLKGIRKFC